MTTESERELRGRVYGAVSNYCGHDAVAANADANGECLRCYEIVDEALPIITDEINARLRPWQQAIDSIAILLGPDICTEEHPPITDPDTVVRAVAAARKLDGAVNELLEQQRLALAAGCRKYEELTAHAEAMAKALNESIGGGYFNRNEMFWIERWKAVLDAYRAWQSGQRTKRSGR